MLRVVPQHLGAGYGLASPGWVIGRLGTCGARSLEVGTGSFGFQLAFYQRQGFRVSRIERDFFARNYPQPVFENGIRLLDMLRLALDFPVGDADGSPAV